MKKEEKIIHITEFLETFEKFKQILTNAPLFQIPDCNKPFILTCYAYNVAIDVTLSYHKDP